MNSGRVSSGIRFDSVSVAYDGNVVLTVEPGRLDPAARPDLRQPFRCSGCQLLTRCWLWLVILSLVRVNGIGFLGLGYVGNA